MPRHFRRAVWIVHVVSISRVIAGFGFVSTAAAEGYSRVAAVLYVYAVLSDLLDGFLARRLRLRSEFGAALDIVRDRYLTVISTLFFVWLRLPILPCCLLLGRDIILSGLRVVRVGERPLLAVERPVGIVTAAPIKVLTVTLLLVSSDVITGYFMGFAAAVWILAGWYTVSLCVSLWRDRERLREAVLNLTLE
jgi:phosphatidylglycerophosphate synthase